MVKLSSLYDEGRPADVFDRYRRDTLINALQMDVYRLWRSCLWVSSLCTFTYYFSVGGTPIEQQQNKIRHHDDDIKEGQLKEGFPASTVVQYFLELSSCHVNLASKESAFSTSLTIGYSIALLRQSIRLGRCYCLLLLPLLRGN
jgi:hypothetical protein